MRGRHAVLYMAALGGSESKRAELVNHSQVFSCKHSQLFAAYQLCLFACSLADNETASIYIRARKGDVA